MAVCRQTLALLRSLHRRSLMASCKDCKSLPWPGLQPNWTVLFLTRRCSVVDCGPLKLLFLPSSSVSELCCVRHLHAEQREPTD